MRGILPLLRVVSRKNLPHRNIDVREEAELEGFGEVAEVLIVQKHTDDADVTDKHRFLYYLRKSV
jgi:hypothetical protein